jgi:6-phosphogluconolactonase/glucosamine-6-phosphate isomerase/deaminase
MTYQKYPLEMITDWTSVTDEDYVFTQYSDGSGATIGKVKNIHQDDRKIPTDDYSTRYYLIKDKFLYHIFNHLMYLPRYHVAQNSFDNAEEAYTAIKLERDDFLNEYNYGKKFD